MTDLENCAICAGGVAETDVEFELDAPIEWQGAFLCAAPPAPPGVYRLCRLCAAWRPEARTAPPPAGLVAVLAASAVGLHPTTARALRSELLGAGRHLAERLRPFEPLMNRGW